METGVIRLIDANALPVSKEYCVDEAGCGSTFYVVHKDAIDNAPTISSDSLRPKGRWIERTHDAPAGDIVLLHCSRCDTPHARERNFCNECGADMRGEGNGIQQENS